MENHKTWRSGVGFAVLGWAAATMFHTAVAAVGELDSQKSLAYVMYKIGVRYAFWILALPLLAKCVKRFPVPHRDWLRNGTVLLLIVLGLAPLISLVWSATLYLTWFPYLSLFPTLSSFVASYLVRFVQGDLLTGFVVIIALQGWYVWQDLQALRIRASELEGQLAVSRLEVLRMQLHPHFLFNGLHTVASLIGEQPVTARRMVVALGDFLRLTLKDRTDSIRSLAEELEFVDLYMGIEKLRLGDRLTLDYDIEPEATRAEVPQLLLQPLFENAVRHGAARLTGACTIAFRAHRENGRLNLSLENDAPAALAAADAVKGGVGLTNTRARLRLHYGNDFTFEYRDRSQGGVRIDLSFPYRQQTESRNFHDGVASTHARSHR